jgi:hypothetical protein
MIKKPTYPIESDYFAGYVKKAKGTDLIKALEENLFETQELFQGFIGKKESYQYSAGKWTVKQILQHIIDTERVFSYRALRMARKDNTPLPGYEEDDYAANDNSRNRSLADILTEFHQVRMVTISLFDSFANDVLDFEAEASNTVFTPRIIGWMLCGHAEHHNRVVELRYMH